MKPGSTLLVCFDGLRRDRAIPDRMPNLCRFMADGTNIINSRSVFPSETRVAVSSTVTGCPPGLHGLVANQFYNHQAVSDDLFRTARKDHLAIADERGVLIDREALGEKLHRAGKSFAVVTTASPGATFMMNHRAARHGQPVFSVHPGIGTPELMETTQARFGPVPKAATPNTAQIDHATRVLMEIVYPTHRPDLAILWMSDPDITSHRFGIDAAQTVAAQRGCDDAFGRILDWWQADGGPQNIVVMSDHGQITGTRQFDLLAALPEYAEWLSPGSFSGLHLPDPSPDAIRVAVERLAEEPACGLIFVNMPGDPAASVPGALPASLMGSGHQRSAPVSFTLRADGQATSGTGETCLFADYIQPGGGMHGGLTRGELSTVLAGSGPAFRSGFVSETPAWLPDIAPTLLTVLGLPCEGAGGRVLGEALAFGDGPAPSVTRRTLSATIGQREQGVEQWLVDGRAITDFGWSSSPGGMPS